MNERFALAGFPTTPQGWATRLLVQVAIYLWFCAITGWPWLLTAILLMAVWATQVATALWVEGLPARFLGYTASWLLLWRAMNSGLHQEQPWYQPLLIALFLASIMIWAEEQRKKSP